MLHVGRRWFSLAAIGTQDAFSPLTKGDRINCYDPEKSLQQLVVKMDLVFVRLGGSLHGPYTLGDASLEACNGGDVFAWPSFLPQAGWIQSKRKQRRTIVSCRVWERRRPTVETLEAKRLDRVVGFVVVTLGLSEPERKK